MDLPEVWNAKIQEYLGVTPPNDSLGVLQDMHWSAGHFGSFPTYTIGNVMSAQFFEAALKKPDVQEGLNSANYQPLLKWLIENIYQYGRTYSPDEILQRATGSSLDVKPYLDYIQQKYDGLFPTKI